jgi:LysM repeat protein
MSRVKKAIEKAKAARDQEGIESDEGKPITHHSQHQAGPDAASGQRPIIVISTKGALILLLIAISSFAFGINEKLSRPDLDEMQARFEQLEKETKVFQNIFMGIATLEGQVKELQASISKKNESVKLRLASLSDEVANLKSTRPADSLKSGEYYALNTASPSESVKPKAEMANKRVVKNITAAKATKSKRAEIAHAKDGYHEVSEGETLYRISVNYGVSVDDLCRINKIDPTKYIIHPGQKILLASR